MLSPALKEQVAHLSLPERLELFEALRDSVIPPEADRFSELSGDQVAELMRRAERAEEQPNAGSSWEEVKQRIVAG